MDKNPKFIRYLEKKGVFASVVSIRHLADLRSDIDALHEKGLLDETFYSEYANPYFEPQLPRNFGKAKSIIVVSIPQPKIRTTFCYNGRQMHLTVPPTYFDYYPTYRRVKSLLIEAFRPKSYRFARAVLPVKTLAVRSGLALYGRNNITYIPKYGSFHRLMAFYSDYESPIDNWNERRALPLCDKCKACANVCPTNAIQKERFLLHVERCLPFFNEKDSKHAFPDWIDPSAHNCIVGCMLCQKACPYDKDIINWCEDRGIFSEEETAYLLKGKFTGIKAKKMDKKLKRVGLDLTIFPRNLKVFISKR
ncbi:MAG: 4Fe-4S binding protein [Thermoplasmata archaeon]|nr:4Fe-4S binding protein [Thermoplasmata archaeon]